MRGLGALAAIIGVIVFFWFGHNYAACQSVLVQLNSANAPAPPETGWPGWAWALMTTCPSPSTSPNSCCGSGPWPAASPPPSPASSAPAESSGDPLRRAVTCHGQQIGLSPKEFAVLEALMTAAPAALSAEALLAQVWDENADPFTKTVQVTIGRLRRKLDDPDVIETIPGVG
jgi:hypothetical protein